MVVTEEQGKSGFIRIFTRNVIRFLETALVYLPSVILIIVTKKRQRIGDLLAGTVVIRQ